VKDDKDQVLNHDYDGIQEYDNRLPNWWLTILFGSIVFAFAYWFYFQTFRVAPTPEARLQGEMARAAEAQLARSAGQELTDDALILMSTIPERVAEGQTVFKQFCVVCHGEMGEGKVGPNLTDGFWLHGAKPLQIHGTVSNGVTEKGMAAWGNQLGPKRVEQVVSYVLTLKGKNVPGKEPQGEPES
jgi:cytochrome c oxidase cbb3-type subunit 3